MTLGRAGPSILKPASLETSIEELLLPLDILLELGDLGLFLLEQFLEAVLEFLLICGTVPASLGLPVTLLFLQVVDLFLEDLNVEL